MNFYNDDKDIKYLKTTPVTPFYLNPVKITIIKIVICESVIHCITNYNKYGLYGNNDENDCNLKFSYFK